MKASLRCNLHQLEILTLRPRYSHAVPVATAQTSSRENIQRTGLLLQRKALPSMTAPVLTTQTGSPGWRRGRSPSKNEIQDRNLAQKRQAASSKGHLHAGSCKEDRIQRSTWIRSCATFTLGLDSTLITLSIGFLQVSHREDVTDLRDFLYSVLETNRTVSQVKTKTYQRRHRTEHLAALILRVGIVLSEIVSSLHA